MDCQVCDCVGGSCEMSHLQNRNEWIQRVVVEDNTCTACGAIVGGFHHADCLKEVCPICNGSLVRCECFPAQLVLGAA